MKLKSFSVEGYKIFGEKFTIDFIDDNLESQFTILTGKNNVGKSTLLEAIDKFFEKATKANSIPNECFNSELIKNAKEKAEIVMESEIFLQDDDEINFFKYPLPTTLPCNIVN